LSWDIQSLFRRHAGEIDRFLRRRGHSTDVAADITQDTFVRVMTANPQGKDDNPRAYLHQVARNLSLDFYRRERLVEYVDLPEEEFRRIADDAPTSETVVYDRQRLAIIEQALLEMPEQTRQAFISHRLGEKTMSEVGAELGLSTSRVWTLIRRAYLHLRSRLKEDAV